MSEERLIFEILRPILLWLSPFVFLVGMLLLLSKESYNNIESKLNKEIGGIKKKIIPIVENNIDILHNWVLARSFIFGLLFVAYFILLFIFLLKK